MQLTGETIEKISEHLKSIPPKNKFSKKEAIEKLSGEIQELKQKGYSIKEIKEILEKQGLKTSIATLRNCLPISKKKQKKTEKGNSKKTKNTQEEKILIETATQETQKGFVQPDPDEI